MRVDNTIIYSMHLLVVYCYSTHGLMLFFPCIFLDQMFGIRIGTVVFSLHRSIFLGYGRTCQQILDHRHPGTHRHPCTSIHMHVGVHMYTYTHNTYTMSLPGQFPAFQCSIEKLGIIYICTYGIRMLLLFPAFCSHIITFVYLHTHKRLTSTLL